MDPFSRMREALGRAVLLPEEEWQVFQENLTVKRLDQGDTLICDRKPSPITIEALTDAETVYIDYKALQDFYRRFPLGERTGRLMAEYQYVKRLQREMDLLSLTAEERYKELLAKHPTLVRDLSVKHLSSYLGMQPESLSRIRKGLAGN